MLNSAPPDSGLPPNGALVDALAKALIPHKDTKGDAFFKDNAVMSVTREIRESCRGNRAEMEEIFKAAKSQVWPGENFS